VVASVLGWAGAAWAEEEPEGGALERADLSGAYMDDELVSKARRGGMGQEVLRAVDEPATPNDVRIALIDAAARSGRSKGMAKRYARMLEARARGRALTLDEMATHELLALAQMRAHDDPKGLSAMGGDAEFERATPAVLITAAVNRQRGDQAIHLINGLIKAQQKTANPEQALCEPGACVETAMKPFGREWSVRPAAVCAAYEAARGEAEPRGKLARMCDLHAEEHAKGPVYARDAAAEAAQASAAKRFSAPTPQSTGGNPMGGMGQIFGLGAGGALGMGVPVTIPPNATPEQVEQILEKALIDEMKKQDPMMGALLEQSLKMGKAQMKRRRSARPRPRVVPQYRPTPRAPTRAANPQEITLSPEEDEGDDEGGIEVLGGDETTNANQEIILEGGDDEDDEE
jgi:hypothetical protein